VAAIALVDAGAPDLDAGERLGCLDNAAQDMAVVDSLAPQALRCPRNRVKSSLSTRQESGGRLNNRAENSHQPTRRRERSWIGWNRPGTTQRFLSSQAAVYNTFNIQRHLISRRTLHTFRTQAMAHWAMATAAA
jgi:transposase-like protein